MAPFFNDFLSSNNKDDTNAGYPRTRYRLNIVPAMLFATQPEMTLYYCARFAWKKILRDHNLMRVDKLRNTYMSLHGIWRLFHPSLLIGIYIIYLREYFPAKNKTIVTAPFAM